VAKRGKSQYGNETVSLQEIEEYIEELEEGHQNLEKFQSKWDEDMEKEMNLCLNCLQTGDDNKGILAKIQKILEPPDPLLLDGKISKLRNGNYRFQNTEDLQMEYKQSMFSPDYTQIDETDMEPELYKKKVAGKKNDLINEICSSVCAFLNTNDGSIYIGVDDKSRNVIGLSDDKGSEKWKKITYTNFQEKYKIAIMNELQKRTIDGDNEPLDLDNYVSGIKYHGPYGKDDIDLLEIPCKKIPSSESPVWLKNKLDEYGNPIKGGERKLYKRVMKNSGSDEVVPENEQKKFFKKYFKEWYES
jgi:phenylpyruvate tautomerase PptA (4-oxalocrotonate tautomerase family)